MALFWKDIINRIIESCLTHPDHKIISIIQIFTTILIQITESCPKVHWSAHLWATASSSEFHTRARMSDAWRWREDHDGDQEGGEGDGDCVNVYMVSMVITLTMTLLRVLMSTK